LWLLNHIIITLWLYLNPFSTHTHRRQTTPFSTLGAPRDTSNWIMKSTRTLDYYYEVSTLATLGCHKVILDDTDIWHQYLGHINFKDLLKIFEREAVCGLPNLQTVRKMMCGACLEGKQTKTQHKKTTNILTSKPFELLHINLMGPTQTKSLCGKKYIMVMVDDYLRYSWAILLR